MSDLETPPSGWWWNPDVSPAELDQMLAANNGRLVSLSVRSVSPKRLAAVWVAKGPGEDGAGWGHDLDAAALDGLKKKQARIVALAPFVKNGKARFAAAWIPNQGASQIDWGWDPDVNLAGVGQLLGNDKGRPIVLASYLLGGQRHRALVWVDNHPPHSYGWWWNPDVDGATLAGMLSANQGRLVSLDPFMVNGKLRFGGVWVENTGAHAKGWYWYHGLGPEALGHRFDLFCCYPVEVGTYPVGNGTHLSCVMYVAPPKPAAESDKLLEITSATGELASFYAGMSPENQQMKLTVKLKNPTGAEVVVSNGRVGMHESGGFMDWTGPAVGGDALLGITPVKLAPGQEKTFGPKTYAWGMGAADFVVDLHAESGAKKQHLSRVVPTVRAGFPAPPALSAPVPVYIGLWDSPPEIISVWRGDKETRWITVAGQIVNTSGTTVRLAAWHLTLEIDGKKVLDEELPLTLWANTPTGAVFAPVGADGAAYLPDLTNFFAHGFELPKIPKGFTTGKLTLGANYKVGVAGGACGYASFSAPVRFFPAVSILPPVKGLPADRFWQYGNGPDHTGLDAHDWPQERYAYDVGVVDGTGKTSDQADAASMQKNTNFYIYGQPIFAVAAGTVAGADDTREENFGNKPNPAVQENNYVLIKHPDGTYSGYYHLRKGKNLVTAGDTVSAGQQIGQVGNAGGSSEPHLHFAVSKEDPTGRYGNAPTAISGLKTKADKKVTGVPGSGQYKG
ncbi:MAG: M23 family metallopeptidase [Longimicrobiaceae bacterium]